MDKERDILLVRFNKEAEVLMGASQEEVVRGGLLVFLPTALLFAIMTMVIFSLSFIVGLFGFAFGLLVGIGVFFIVFSRLKNYRKGKEIGYVTQLFQRKLSRAGYAYTHVVHHSKTWMVGKLI